MSKQLHQNPRAEQEANEVAMRFMDSTDVVGDMSRAYGKDFSSVRIHTDEAADQRVAGTGADAFAQGRDVFFARGAFDRSDPASRGLLAHELTHTMQQSGGGEGVQQSAPSGAAQGGIIDWFRGLFGGRRKKRDEISISDPISVERDTSPEAEAYRLAMQRATALPNQVEGRFNPAQVGQMGSSANFLSLAPEGVSSSNQSFGNSNLESDEAIKTGLVSLGIRGGATSPLVQADKEMRGSIFDQLPTDQLEYLQRVEQQVDTSRFESQKQTTQLPRGSNSYTSGAGYDEMTSDFLDMFGQYATSDESVAYLSTMQNTLGGADVFTKGGQDPLNFFMQNLLNRTAANPAALTQAVGQGKLNPETRAMALSTVKTLMTLPILSQQTDVAQAALPPAIQELIAKYNNLLADIRSKMAVKPDAS